MIQRNDPSFIDRGKDGASTKASTNTGLEESNGTTHREISPDHPELGASTAEYGVVMLAAVGFAGLLVAILKSGEVKELLMGIIRTALSTG